MANNAAPENPQAQVRAPLRWSLISSAAAETTAVPDVKNVAYLSLANRRAELETLSIWVAQLCEDLEIATGTALRIDLVLAEAVQNIIDYAYPDGAARTIGIAFCHRPDSQLVQLRIEDDGAYFDPTQAPDASLGHDLQSASVGGLGIHLIRSYCRECSYQRIGHKNVLTLVVSCAA